MKKQILSVLSVLSVGLTCAFLSGTLISASHACPGGKCKNKKHCKLGKKCKMKDCDGDCEHHKKEKASKEEA